MVVNKQGYWIIPFSIVIALMLTIMPLPEWAKYFRPEWLSMVCIYWALATPYRFGLISAWVAGLFLDVAIGSLLGQHAIGLTLVAYIVLHQHQKLRLAPVSQQSLIVFFLLLIKQTIALWISGIIDQKPESILLYYAPALVSLFLWPWVMVILRNLRRSAHLK